MEIYKRLLEFLCLLEQRNLHYTLEHNREDAIMVLVASPMKRWEIEFFSDGHVETDVYLSEGVHAGKEAETELEQFWRENWE